MSLVLLPTTVHSADQAQTVSPVGLLFDLSGLDVQIQQVPIAIKHGFESAAPNSEEAVANWNDTEISEALDLAFEPMLLRESLLENLLNEMSSAETRKVIDWYTTPTGQRVTQAEKSHAVLVEQAERRAFYRNLNQNPPDVYRLELMKSIRDGWAMTQQSVDLMIDMQIAVSMAVMTEQAASKELMLQLMREHFDQQRSLLEEQYNRENLYAVLYVYQSVSDMELEVYRDFLHSELGQHYVASINDGMRIAMLKGSLRLGDSMAILARKSDRRKTL